MKIKRFAVEEWMNAYEDNAKYNIAGTCFDSISSWKEGICNLYQTVKPKEIITTHGAAGANHHVFYSLIEPHDHVIVFTPTYQQLYSIPESFGAEVEQIHLEEKDGYLTNIETLKKAIRPDTKMICINNPNNPTGAHLSSISMKRESLSAVCLKYFHLLGFD